MSRSRQEIFEELGLMEDAEPSNPIRSLGVSSEFALELLELDGKGDILRQVLNDKKKSLSKVYHPDTSTVEDSEEKFREIEEASTRISSASVGTLRKWAKENFRSNKNQENRLLEERLERFKERGARLLLQSLELMEPGEHKAERFGESNGLIFETAKQRDKTFYCAEEAGSLFVYYPQETIEALERATFFETGKNQGVWSNLLDTMGVTELFEDAEGNTLYLQKKDGSLLVYDGSGRLLQDATGHYNESVKHRSQENGRIKFDSKIGLDEDGETIIVTARKDSDGGIRIREASNYTKKKKGKYNKTIQTSVEHERLAVIGSSSSEKLLRDTVYSSPSRTRKALEVSEEEESGQAELPDQTIFSLGYVDPRKILEYDEPISLDLIPGNYIVFRDNVSGNILFSDAKIKSYFRPA